MSIAPLQLPVWKDLPQLNFAPLDQAGDAIGAYRQRGALADNLPAMLGMDQPQQGGTLGTLGQPQAASPAAAPQGGNPNAGVIAGIESGGNYGELGPVIQNGAYAGDRAYGKYQVMGKNVPQWTAEVLGKPMSPQEFLASPQAQDAVFNAKFGQLSQKYGPEGAARAWFAGEGGMNDMGRTDQLGTSVAAYSRKFLAGGGGAAPNTAMAFNGPNPPIASGAPTQPTFADRFSPVYGGGAAPMQTASLPPAGASTPPSGQPTQPAQPQPQQVAQAQPAAAPGAAATPTIPPQTIARLQAMIRAGGSAQQFAMAMLQKYVVPQTPVVVNEGGIAFNPVTGAVIARGAPKTATVSAGGAAINPSTGQVIYQAPNKPISVAPGASLVQPDTGKPVFQGGGTLTPAAIDLTARRMIQGDRSAIQEAGNGTLGAAARQAVINRMAELGATSEQMAAAKASFDTQIKATESFGAGPLGTQVKQYSVVADHLQLLRDLSQALQNPNANPRALNTIRNAFYKEFGYDAPTNVDALKQLVGGEIVKGITNSEGALGDREEMLSHLSTANSPEQITGVIDKVYNPAIASQMKALQRQYRFSTKQDNFEEMLSDRAKQMLHSGEGASQQSQALPKVTDRNQANAAIAAARKAIAGGKDRAAVNAALQQMGIPPLTGN